MKRAMWAVVAVLVLMGCAPPDPQKAYDEGENFLNQGLLDEAIPKFQMAVKYKPDFAEAWGSLGQAYFAAGRFTEAAEAAGKSVDLTPDDPSMRMFLGICQMLGRQYADGEKTFADLLASHPTYDVAELNMKAAQALQAGTLTHGCYETLSEGLGSGRGPTDLAMRPFYQSVIETCPDFVTARFELGQVQLKDRNLEEARAEFLKVVEMDPTNAKAHRSLGFLASRAGDLETAINHYKTALSLDPELSDAHFELGAVYGHKRAWRRMAVEQLRIYLEQQPEGQWSLQAQDLIKKYQ